MTLYLTESLNFSLSDVGWIMSAFGLGSIVGSWLGGKLSDKLGFHKVMLWSLIISAFLFINLQYLKTFEGFCIGVFALMSVADAYRPASYVALRAYSKPENLTRSLSLIRLAINLGFSMGPALGGWIIVMGGYDSLFWIDAITCLGAAVIFYMMLDDRAAREAKEEQDELENPRSPYKDGPYWMFLVAVFLTGFAFLQYFSTVPLYYADAHGLSEDAIGWLMAMNGGLIFILEMPMIKWLENPRFSIYRVLIIGTILFAASFFVMNLSSWVGVLWIGMLLMTVGEILDFPFLNRFSMDRSKGGKSGEYMALFAMSFSLAHIVAHNSGMQLVANIGYEATWYIMTGALLLAAVIIAILRGMVEKEDGQ